MPLCYIPLASVHVASMHSNTGSPQNVAFLGVGMSTSTMQNHGNIYNINSITASNTDIYERLST